jgi:uncharacterized protein (DUF2267 family)
MAASFEHSIDHTVQVTREWVHELSRLLDWSNEHRTYRLLRVSLQALRDCLDVNEAAQLAAQLPTLVRGLYFEAWQPAHMRAADRSRDAFVGRIGAAFSGDPIPDVEEAMCCVFRLLNARISPGEVADVRMRLPKSLRDLWPQ